MIRKQSSWKKEKKNKTIQTKCHCKTLPHLEAKKNLKVLILHNIQTTTRAPKN
jgi:hypothetical protein